MRTSKGLKAALSEGSEAEKGRAVVEFWGAVGEWFPVFTAHRCTGLNIKLGPDGWYAVVKARTATHEDVVAFVGGADVSNLLWAVAYAAVNGLLSFRPDRWA